MLGSIVSHLASPTAHWRKFWVKKNWKKKFKNELPELPRNHPSRGGGFCHGQPDGWHRRVTSKVAPCSSKAQLKIRVQTRTERWKATTMIFIFAGVQGSESGGESRVAPAFQWFFPIKMSTSFENQIRVPGFCGENLFVQGCVLILSSLTRILNPCRLFYLGTHLLVQNWKFLRLLELVIGDGVRNRKFALRWLVRHFLRSLHFQVCCFSRVGVGEWLVWIPAAENAIWNSPIKPRDIPAVFT